MKQSLMNVAQKCRNTARNAWAKTTAGATAAGAMVMSGSAFAQDGLGAAALAEVSNIRTDVAAILAVLVGVVFLLVAWSYFKRTK